jgi:hypothetical protein
VDEDRLSPELGRLIDAAKAVARQAAPSRAEGWAVLAADGNIYAGPDAAAALDAVPGAGAPQLLAVAFAVVGDSADTLLPRGDWRRALAGLDPGLPVVVKYLGRWVVVTLAEIPCA